MHMHRLITPGLADLGDDMSYLDVEFTFSGDEARKATYRLTFCPPSLDPVSAETMHQMLGEEVYALCVSVVTYADTVQLDRFFKQMENPVSGDVPLNMFGKPDDGLDLTIAELQYLYGTLVDFMLKVADNEGIQILFFAAEREELHPIYNRYVKRLASSRGVTYINDGAAYAIRTKHYPDKG